MYVTQSRIIEILETCPNLTSDQIMKKMEKKRYDIAECALNKNLKIMAKEGRLTRKADGKPWRYYYNLNKEERISQK